MKVSAGIGSCCSALVDVVVGNRVGFWAIGAP